LCPHDPQFRKSFWGFTQTEPQQVRLGLPLDPVVAPLVPPEFVAPEVVGPPPPPGDPPVVAPVPALVAAVAAPPPALVVVPVPPTPVLPSVPPSPSTAVAPKLASGTPLVPSDAETPNATSLPLSLHATRNVRTTDATTRVRRLFTIPSCIDATASGSLELQLAEPPVCVRLRSGDFAQAPGGTPSARETGCTLVER
jgi:hypothetical protein